MTQNASPDTTAGDPTPELTQASLIKAVTMLNKIGFNLEIPNAGVAGPIQAKRGIVISTNTTPPTQVAGYGVQLTVSQGSMRSTLLQQSVNTNDERLYLLNNASPTAGVFSGTFIYDKTGASASYYLQQSGVHYFATAPNGAKDANVTFSQKVRIDSVGLNVTGEILASNDVGTNSTILNLTNTVNGSNLHFASVNTPNAYIQGSLLGDSAIRAETNNLVLGALAGNTTIGTSTKTLVRFNTNGTVVIPGTNGLTTSYGGFAVGNGITIVVGNGSNSASEAKGYWIYRDNAPSFIGASMQFNAQNGLDFWTGNAASTGWNRTLQIQTNGKVLVGGVQAATAIGDLHVNIAGADISGSLSLTGASNASYLLMGNRDSLGTAGPAVIASSNRQIQFGVGDSFITRGGGTFTQAAVISGGSLGVGITNPESYDKFVVDVHGTTPYTQLFRTYGSPANANIPGNLGGGYGVQWGNVFVGSRAVNGGDADNAGLAFIVSKTGVNGEAGRFDIDRNLTIKGPTLYLGTLGVSILGCGATGDSYFRGTTLNFQNVAGSTTWLQVTSSLITNFIDTQFNGNVTVSGTIVSSRQIEATTDKALSSGVITFDYNTNAQWVCASQTANFTANFTNITGGIAHVKSLTLIIQQGAVGYGPTAVQINGVAKTVKWAGGMAPVWTPNNIDVCVFSLIWTTSSTWIVLGSVTPYV